MKVVATCGSKLNKVKVLMTNNVPMTNSLQSVGYDFPKIFDSL